jgi:hypothetical protein
VRYRLGMTSTAPSKPKSGTTALARIAGVLLVVSALATIGGETINVILENRVFSGQGDTNEPFEFLGPTILLGGVAILSMIVGYVLLFAWLPKTLPNGVFLALALVPPLNYLLQFFPWSPIFLDFLHAAVALVAGVYVLARRVFPLVTSILFALAMLLTVLEALGGQVSGLLDGSLVVEAAAMFSWAGALLLFGLALLICPRTRSTATE